MMIDRGFCFDDRNWNFPDAPLHSLCDGRSAYRSVVGIETFDRWLDQLENELTMKVLREEARRVPPEWYGEDHENWNRLIERLFVRRTQVRELSWSS
jgi:hypothetical protein